MASGLSLGCDGFITWICHRRGDFAPSLNAAHPQGVLPLRVGGAQGHSDAWHGTDDYYSLQGFLVS
eukprot:CAMPEP_0179259640 /NCGR_PEP_ID=MMETSP0797-20121207/25928_1 /TAXON_ID=47934 /ORGANISM="Dinophysis acuminata, Strain DAEP01" /LENGTH=65 /DNA_ID=CAMNT_0020967695 /DNA_START=18 /DNA_END=215 /DNA_ORIENTATION=-